MDKNDPYPERTLAKKGIKVENFIEGEDGGDACIIVGELCIKIEGSKEDAYELIMAIRNAT